MPFVKVGTKCTVVVLPILLSRRSTSSILGFKSDNSSNGIDANASSLSGAS